MEATKLFELAQLAEASYGDFRRSSIKLALEKDINDNLLFSDTQITEFASHWQVISHQPDTVNGFSATLFKYIGPDDSATGGNKPGDFVYAIRGTAGSSDLLGADGGDIVLDGLALDQILDLYNDWTRLNTINGQTYQAAVLATNTLLTEELQESQSAWDAYNANPLVVPMPTLLTPAQLIATWQNRHDVVIDLPSNTVRSVEFQNSNLVFSGIDVRAFGSNPSGFTGQLAEVVGHSLGGHLAAAFTRLFPETGAEALTVNAAGFGKEGLLGIGTNGGFNVSNLFSMLGGDPGFNWANIHNIFGDKNSEFITMDGPGLFQPGSHDKLFIEQSSVNAYTFGHGTGQMTDSLAVANLFIKLDSALASETPYGALSKLNELFELSSNKADTSLEKLVEGLTEIIFGFKPTITVDDRESLYSAIHNITVVGAELFNGLVGEIKIVAAPASIDEAKIDFGAFLSLVNLTPFALSPLSTNAEEILKTANPYI